MLEVIDTEVSKIVTELITEEELIRNKNKLRSEIYSVYDSGSDLAKDRLDREFFGLGTLEDFEAQIDSVTSEDIQKVAQRIFGSGKKSMFTMNSEESL